MKIPRGAVKFPQNKASWVGGADDNLKPFFSNWKMYSERSPPPQKKKNSTVTSSERQATNLQMYGEVQYMLNRLFET